MLNWKASRFVLMYCYVVLVYGPLYISFYFVVMISVFVCVFICALGTHQLLVYADDVNLLGENMPGVQSAG
jgi:hypothetical protein